MGSESVRSQQGVEEVSDGTSGENWGQGDGERSWSDGARLTVVRIGERRYEEFENGYAWDATS